MVEIRNNIPVTAMLYEPSVAILISIIAILSYRKYRNKRSEPTKFLSYSMIFLSLSILATGTGKVIMFFAPFTPEEFNVTGFTILIGYCLSATSNIFAARFIQSIFKDENSNFAFYAAIGNGITIGFIISKIIDPDIAFKTYAYNKIVPALIWHIIMTALTYSSLIIVSRNEAKNATTKLMKTGFKLISYYGIGYLLVFVFFIADLFYGTARGKGYTIFYYLGWTSAAVAIIFAYLGYIMPDWFRKKLV